MLKCQGPMPPSGHTAGAQFVHSSCDSWNLVVMVKISVDVGRILSRMFGAEILQTAQGRRV